MFVTESHTVFESYVYMWLQCYLVQTRCEIPGVRYIKVDNNREMSETILNVIVSLNPILTVGHNNYIFNNIKMAVNLPEHGKYRQYFTPYLQ